MSRFASLIRATSDRLDLPPSIKSRVLLEVAADLDDFYEHYRSQGFSEELATEKVATQIDFSDEALDQLIQVHASLYRRLMNGLSERTGALWERVMLIVLAAFIAVGTMEVMMTTKEIVPMTTEQILADVNGFIWLVAVLGVAGLIVGLIKAHALYIKKDHDVRHLHRGLDALVGIGFLSVAIGFYAAVVDLYRIAMLLVHDAERFFLAAVIWVIRSAPVVNLGLLVAVVTTVLWFLFTNKVARIEEAEASVLVGKGGES